jgi:3-oxoacyl-[acyl-carrier-protein] synthase-1
MGMTSQSTNCQLSAMGMVNALGRTPGEIFLALTSGQAEPLEIESRVVAERSIPVGRVRGELPNIPESLSHIQSRNLQVALCALDQIADEISSERERIGSDRIVVGSSTAGIAEGELAIEHLEANKERKPGYFFQQQEMGTVAASLASLLNLQGPSYTISTACSTSAKVFGSAQMLMQMDICDAVIVGGVDSMCGLTLNGFTALDLTSSNPTLPFSKNREGINIGEGAALFLLTKRPGGVQMLGIGEASDAYHISTPDPEARGAVTALRQALKHAGVTPEDVWYINLHGTGTLHNDEMEAKAVSTVFGSRTYCSSTKPMVGHMLGASGATEVGFCYLALKDFLARGEQSLNLPVHLYDGAYDPSIEAVQLVTEPTALKRAGRPVCLSNSFGFGGSNCAVALGA